MAELSLTALLTTGWSGLAIALFVGTLFGFIAGIIPGIGGKIGIVLSIPIATFWDPIGGAVFLFAMHSVVHTSASIPAIAFALPSTAADAATILDGYPMAKSGRAGEALGASLSASAVGGVLGALAFLASIPIARLILKWIGPPEFLILALAGLSMVAVLAGRNLLAGLLVAAFGFLAAMVGIDVQTSASRFTLGFPELYNGLNIIAIIGGLFVVPEMLTRWSYDETGHHRAISTSISDVYEGMKKTFSHIGLVVRSSLYGIGIGMMPGLGSSVSVWLSYSHAVANTKSEVPFGQGAVAGVIAPEAANNSKEGGAMVPTLFFGIPGSSSMAIMLGAFVVIGQPIGPSLLTTDINTSFILVATLILANLIAIPMFFAVVPSIVRLAALRREHMVPLAISIALFAALYQSMQLSTLAQFMIGGTIGIALSWANWPRAPFLLGFMMGPVAEISFIQTSQIWGWEMFYRPASVVLLVFFVFVGVKAYRYRPAKASSLGFSDKAVGLPIFALFAYAFYSAYNFPDGASNVPIIISAIGLALSALLLLKCITNSDPMDQDENTKFDGVASTLGYFLIVPFLGLPLASALYTFLILRRIGTRFATSGMVATGLAIVQLVALSLILDIYAEPLITGWIVAAIGNY